METNTIEKTWRNDYVKRLRAIEKTVKDVITEILDYAQDCYMERFNDAKDTVSLNNKDKKSLNKFSSKSIKSCRKFMKEKLNIYSELVNKCVYEPKNFNKEQFYKFTNYFLSSAILDVVKSVDFLDDIVFKKDLTIQIANYVKDEKPVANHFSKNFEGIEDLEDIDRAIDFQELAEKEIKLKEETRLKDQMTKESNKDKKKQEIAIEQQKQKEMLKLAKEKSQALNKIRKDKNIGEKAEIKAVVNDKLAALIADAQDILKYGRNSEISSLISAIMLNADYNQKNMPEVSDMSIQALEKKKKELDQVERNIEEIFVERKPYISVADRRITEVYPAESV